MKKYAIKQQYRCKDKRRHNTCPICGINPRLKQHRKTARKNAIKLEIFTIV